MGNEKQQKAKKEQQRAKTDIGAGKTNTGKKKQNKQQKAQKVQMEPRLQWISDESQNAQDVKAVTRSWLLFTLTVNITKNCSINRAIEIENYSVAYFCLITFPS